MSNFLGKLKNIIGGNEDYQYYEEEIEEMATQEFDPSVVESASLSEKESSPKTPIQTEKNPRTNKEYSFQMPLPPEPLMDESDLTNSLPSNVIGMPRISTAMNEVVVIEAHSFDEIPQVIQTLKEQRCVVLNLNVMDPDEAQRAVDFVAGGTYAIDGHQERIGESIFLFTPRSVKVSNLSGKNQQSKKNSVGSQILGNTFSTDSLWNDPPTNISNQLVQ